MEATFCAVVLLLSVHVIYFLDAAPYGPAITGASGIKLNALCRLAAMLSAPGVHSIRGMSHDRSAARADVLSVGLGVKRGTGMAPRRGEERLEWKVLLGCRQLQLLALLQTSAN